MMKKFFLIVCGSFVGSFLALVVMTLVGVAMSMALMFTVQQHNGVSSHSVLYLDLTGPIEERPATASIDVMSYLQGQQRPQSLSDMLKALQVAKTDGHIEGVVLDCGGTEAAPATLHQLRTAISDFKKASGKPVLAYANEGYSQADYYLATAADSVFLNPVGVVDVHGLSSFIPHFRGLLDKAGVDVQVLRVGAYKSAVEPYVLDSISPANRQQTQVYLNQIWGVMARDMAQARKMTVTRFNALADTLLITRQASQLKQMGLVDGLAYRHEFDDRVRAISHLDSDDDLRLAYPQDLVPNYDAGKAKQGVIAVVYATGEIDAAQTAPVQTTGINSSDLVQTIEDLAKDDEVRGMVLRVNSPGGSAHGSEQIWEAVEQFKRTGKAVAVSMGDYAASGGYYISCGAQRIFADSTTITGSIGIFGLVPCAQRLMRDKLGVNMSVVKTNANPLTTAGLVSFPLTPVQRAAMQNMVNSGYDLFTRRCAQGRHLSQDSIKAIGQGRVWDAMSARRIGLVDELGGLDKAISWVAQKAQLQQGRYQVSEYPSLDLRMADMLALYGMHSAQSRMASEMGLFYTCYDQLRQLTGRQHILCLMDPVEIK